MAGFSLFMEFVNTEITEYQLPYHLQKTIQKCLPHAENREMFDRIWFFFPTTHVKDMLEGLETPSPAFIHMACELSCDSKTVSVFKKSRSSPISERHNASLSRPAKSIMGLSN